MSAKKVLPIALAVFVIAGFLSGCGGSASVKSKETSANQAAPSQGASGEERQMAGNMYISGLPIAKEKETLHLIAVTVPQHGPYENMQPFKELEAKTNVHIEWQCIPNGSWEQKKRVILASGNLPDGFFGENTYGMSDIARYGPSGTFIKLNDLIDKYGDNIQREFKRDPRIRNACTYLDGNIYSLPYAEEDPEMASPDSMFIYKPWLDKVGLQVPTTIYEFYQALKAFKEKDPNGNGKPDEIPFSCIYADSTAGMGSLFGAFGRVDQISTPDDTILDHFILEDGKIVFTADKDEYKNAIEFFSKCFAEGLFDKEMFTQLRPQYFAKGKAEVPIIGSFFLWNNINMTTPERAGDYVPVPVLKGAAGKQIWRDYSATWNGIDGSGFIITNQCKNPDLAFRWADQFYDKDTSIRMVTMVVNKKADGTYEYAPVPEGLGWDEYRYQNLPVHAPNAITLDDWGKLVPFDPTMVDKMDIINKYYRPYMTNKSLPGMLFTTEESQYFATKGADFQKYIDRTTAKWLLDGGISNDWDAYRSKLKDLGLDEYMKTLQTAYDRYLQQGK